MGVQPAAVDLSLAEMWSSSISLEPLRWRIKMGKYPVRVSTIIDGKRAVPDQARARSWLIVGQSPISDRNSPSCFRSASRSSVKSEDIAWVCVIPRRPRLGWVNSQVIRASGAFDGKDHQPPLINNGCKKFKEGALYESIRRKSCIDHRWQCRYWPRCCNRACQTGREARRHRPRRERSP